MFKLDLVHVTRRSHPDARSDSGDDPKKPKKQPFTLRKGGNPTSGSGSGRERHVNLELLCNRVTRPGVLEDDERLGPLWAEGEEFRGRRRSCRTSRNRGPDLRGVLLLLLLLLLRPGEARPQGGREALGEGEPVLTGHDEVEGGAELGEGESSVSVHVAQLPEGEENKNNAEFFTSANILNVK